MSFGLDSGHLIELLEGYNGSLLFELETNFMLDNNENKIQNFNLYAEKECLISGGKKRKEINDTEIFFQRTSETDTVNNYM